MKQTYIDTLSMPLPEDILKRKWAGDLSGALAAIQLRLQEELPLMLRQRLETEAERIRRLPTQYPWNREQAIAKMQELNVSLVKGFSMPSSSMHWKEKEPTPRATLEQAKPCSIRIL